MTLPEGTVTFLRSDIEGSMKLSRALGARYDELNAEHQAIVRAAVAEFSGQVVRTEGDAFFSVFTDAGAAARAAVAIQAAMREHSWPDGHAFRLRIGIHAGVAVRAGDDYGGFEVSRAARIAATGWGGQIVVSDPARALISAELPDGWTMRDLGKHRLKDVAEPEHLFQLDTPGEASKFQPLRSGRGPAEHLPVRVASFIGRETELAELDRLLRANRLLTLTGPGGTGKTTLALELARRHAAHLPDGTWFVDLQAVREPELVKAEIARGICLFDGPAGKAADRLIDFMADRSMLIVVDNFEQVVEAAGDVGELLQASARSRLIVTSRIPLRLSAEQEYPVRPLEIATGASGDESEAVRLFLARTMRARPDTSFSEGDMATIRETCRLMDGLPLAIELTAARTSILPLHVIRDRLAQRLPLPGTGPRDLPQRQRTMEDAVAWSFDLLEAPVQRLLARTAVFEGSFDLEQAEAICGPPAELGVDILDGLVQLVESSLLARVDDAAGGFRFAALESIRAFAGARLAESSEESEIRARHASTYAELAMLAHPHWQTDEQPAWVARLDADDANLRRALEFAIDHDERDTSYRLLTGLWRYWLSVGRLVTGRELMRRAMSADAGDEPTRLRADALDAAGGIEYWTGDMRAASAYYEEQLAIGKRLGEDSIMALAYYNLTFALRLLGDRQASDEAEVEARKLAHKVGAADLILHIDWAGQLESRIDPASFVARQGPEGEFEELEAIAEQLEAQGDSHARSMGLGTRAQIALLKGEAADAVRYGVEAFRGALALGERADVIIALQPLVVLLLRAGQPTAGAIVLGALDEAIERFGMRPPASFQIVTGVADPEAAFEGALGTEAFAAARERGRKLSLEGAVDVVERASGDLSSLPPTPYFSPAEAPTEGS